MAGRTKTAGTVTLGGVILVAVIIGSKLLGGPDLTGLLVGGNAAEHSTTAERQTDPAVRSTGASSASRASVEPVRSDSQAGSGSGIGAADDEAASETAIRDLIDNRISGEMTEVYAEVVKVLPDDNEGSRHQRLLLTLETGGTVLVAHNIDLAPRVPVAEGEWLTVYGQYEWNERGGVLHWTHHDPKEWREGGWIEHAGVRYE